MVHHMSLSKTHVHVCMYMYICTCMYVCTIVHVYIVYVHVYISTDYRCAYCYHLNPARKTRPIQQPIINTTTPTDMNTRTTNNNDKEQDQDKPEEENDTKETKP